MALDLSKVDARPTGQRRLTTNRDAVLPARQNTDAPALEINARMSSARRGDAGASELMRIFGGAQHAADSFQEYTEAKQSADDRQMAALGEAAQASGNIDPALMEKSREYRVAVSTGESIRGVNDLRLRTEARIAEAFADPSNPPDLTDVDRIVQDEFHAFGTVDGKLRNFGSTEANAAVGKAMTEMQLRFHSEAAAKITEQINTRSIETAGMNAQQDAADGKFDFERSLAQVAPGVDRVKAKAVLIDSVHEWAISTLSEDPDRALAAIDSLLAAKRPDGSFSLSAAERESVRRERMQLGKEADAAKARAEREKFERNTDRLLDRFNRVPGAGSYPSVSEVLEMRKRGEIDAEQANQFVGMIRADREMNGAGVVTPAHSKRGAGDDDTPSSGAAALVLNGAFGGELSTDQARTLAGRLAAQGHFGTGIERYKTLAKLRQNLGVIDSMDRSVRQEVGQDVKVWYESAKRSIGRLPTAQRTAAMRDLDVQAKGIVAKTVQVYKRSKQADHHALARAGMGQAADYLIAKYGLRP